MEAEGKKYKTNKGSRTYSILQGKEKCCYCSGAEYGLQKHHVFYGSGLREISDKNGFWVRLRPQYHGAGYGGLHAYPKQGLELELKKKCQREYEALYGHEAFMKLIGRNYLDDDVEESIPSEDGFYLLQEVADEQSDFNGQVG